MSLSRVLTAFTLSTAALSQGSLDVDLCDNTTDCKQLNITDGNKTFQLAYSTSFAEGREYASCVTDDTFRKVFLNLTTDNQQQDEDAADLSCNTVSFFASKNKSFIVKTQITSLSLDQCKLFENSTWLSIFNCINEMDKNHQQYDSPKSGQGESNEQKSESNEKISVGAILGGIYGGLMVLAIGGACVMGMMGRESESTEDNKSETIKKHDIEAPAVISKPSPR